MSFAQIEERGPEAWLAGLREELVSKTYRPDPVRRKLRIAKSPSSKRVSSRCSSSSRSSSLPGPRLHPVASSAATSRMRASTVAREGRGIDWFVADAGWGEVVPERRDTQKPKRGRAR